MEAIFIKILVTSIVITVVGMFVIKALDGFDKFKYVNGEKHYELTDHLHGKVLILTTILALFLIPISILGIVWF